jgi:hypothetical protein
MTAGVHGWARCDGEQLVRLRSTVEMYGFACLDHALDQDLLEKLQAEAASKLEIAIAASSDGETPYRARIGTLGEVARGLLESPETTDLLHAVFGESLTLTDDASCFTYYRDGDFLSLHCDRAVACRVTMIVYLDAASPDRNAPNTGLALKIYGASKPSGEAPRMVIPTIVGSLVIGRGSETWHERPPLQRGEHVMALTACFSAALPAG